VNKYDAISLKSRWSDSLNELGQSVLSGKGSSPFPSTSEGYADLRGLVIRRFIRGATIASVDLSGALFEGFGQFGSCAIKDSRFRNSYLRSNLGNSFSDCDFGGANLAGAVLRGVFSRCDFSLADLSSSMGSQVRFLGCTFFRANFRKAIFLRCTFEDCHFEECKFGNGSFAHSKFIRSVLPEESLGNTLIDKVQWM